MYVYIVIENGEAYENAYSRYELAAAIVKQKYMLDEDDDASEIDLPENSSGTTRLYVEKGIHIQIIRLSMLVS